MMASWNATEDVMNRNELSLRKLATILGVSQPFLSQIRAGKRPFAGAGPSQGVTPSFNKTVLQAHLASGVQSTAAPQMRTQPP